jgi:O-methyltransferase
VRSIAGKTLISMGRLWALWSLVNQAKWLDGEIWECGVYKGGSAALIRDAIRDRGLTLRLFDTFTGIPCSDSRDNRHRPGDFGGVDVDAVKKLVSYDKVVMCVGVIPETFKGLEDSVISFCHVDVDVYQSVKACCDFVWSRLVRGGIMVFDDYDAPSCSGARLAVDEFFEDKHISPIIIKDTHGSASGVVFKSF